MRDTDWRPSPCPSCGMMRAASEHPLCSDAQCPSHTPDECDHPFCGPKCGEGGRIAELQKQLESCHHRGLLAGQKMAMASLSRGGIAVSAKMVEAAQAAYNRNPDYGLTDSDMRAAIHAAIRALGRDMRRK